MITEVWLAQTLTFLIGGREANVSVLRALPCVSDNHYTNTVTQKSQCAEKPARFTTEYMEIMTVRGHKGNRAQKFW